MRCSSLATNELSGSGTNGAAAAGRPFDVLATFCSTTSKFPSQEIEIRQ